MKDKKELKKLPNLKSDKAAEDFVADADLTQYDLSGFEHVEFEFRHKTARINMRLPASLLEKLKETASRKNIPYSRFIRQILEAAIINGPKS